MILHVPTSIVELAIAALHVALAIVVSTHIILTKEDVRAAIGWMGLVWLSPVVGSVIYVMFGINRIRRRAGRMRARAPRDMAAHPLPAGSAPLGADIPPAWNATATLVGRLTGLPLTAGNDIRPLLDGDEAYPAMTTAIDAATRSVAFATYIFDRGTAGDLFVDALARAVARGVEVRVLIDGVGARYSHPPIVRELRDRGVRVERFLPSLIPIPHPYFNLRNHRKLMVVDGRIAFCGGMNVRDACLLKLAPRSATQDVHFAIRGPVVRQLASAFAFDWEFTTHETLAGEAWFPPLEPAGDVLARGVPDGPDEDFETLLLTLIGAISQAERSIRIVTPYFLPDTPLLDALRVAALRGVRVEIVVPERGNLRTVQWAMNALLPQLIAWGCAVYLSRIPFDHSKLLVIDGVWSLLGSANWDPRSLRLNFEYDVECYSTAFAARLSALVDAKMARSAPASADSLLRRPLWLRLRDGLVRLAQPYL